jgi:hypothetical protein
MSTRDTVEYQVIADKIVSPDEEQDILVYIPEGALYKDSYTEAKRYTTVSDIGNAGAVSAEIPFEVEGGSLGTQPTFNGAPLFTGSYVIAGPTIHFRIDVDFDNITSFGTGQYYLDLPIPSKHNYEFTAGCLHDISTERDYTITAHIFAGESRLALKAPRVSGQTSYTDAFTSTYPITLNVADNFHISGDYIADFE